MYIRTELNDFKTEKQEQEPEDITWINKYHKNEQNLKTKKCFRHIITDTERWLPSNIFNQSWVKALYQWPI